MENTLVDKHSVEVVVENVLMDIEGRLDEGLVMQVPRETPSQRKSQENSG